ncbi:MAG: dienelactone hydrolase family protein [Flavobacteriales bacterium]|nr:dienelactone hydrolase family protein [Flavobacteriales bacterium]
MSIKHHNISVKRTATYSTIGAINTAQTIWFVLHGYGMLAKYFIKKFEPIANDKTLIVAPDGLSKFYTQGFYGRVGATWMTKEDREEEITDYVNYLNQLYDHILSQNENQNVKINLLGFSQGGATVSRWVANGKVKFDNLILWASVFPDDMNFESLDASNTFVLYGDEDEFATNENVQKQKDLLAQSGIDFKMISFTGTHDIPKEVLLEERQKNNW